MGRRKKEGTAQRAQEARRRQAQRYTLESQRIKIPKLTPQQKRRRRLLESDNEAWIWEMFGPKSGILEPLTRPFTSQDCDMIGNFFESLEYGGDDLTLYSRGGGKTSRLRECITKALLTGVLSYGAYFGANLERAGETISYVKESIETSKGIGTLYPEVGIPARECATASSKAKGMLAEGWQYKDLRKHFVDAKLNFAWSENKGLLFPRVPGSPSYAGMFRVFGLEKAVRGLNWLGRRPDGCFIDDPDTAETVNNGEQALKVIGRINSDIGGLRGEGQKMCRSMLATISEKGEGVAFRLSGPESPFVVKRYKFLLEKPDRWDLWMEYVDIRSRCKSKGDKYGRAAHKFYLERRAEMDAGPQPMVANPHRFDPTKLPDGSQVEVSALQFYFDEWADKGEYFCRCELDSERVVDETKLVSHLSPSRMLDCMADFERGQVHSSTTLIVRAVDVRKTELHFATVASDEFCPHNIIDYDVQTHGSQETTTEQAEDLILDGLRRMADRWGQNPYIDELGNPHNVDLTLVDIGWHGSWKTEDGEWKSWATQPVQTFCMERGLDLFLPARGMPRYQEPSQDGTWARWSVVIGNNWYMKKGQRKQVQCDEVSWDANRWHLLVEELFMLPDEDSNGQPYLDRWRIFSPGSSPSPFGTHPGTFRNHKIFGQHITDGARELKEQMNTAIISRKPKFVTDHWWDCLAMCLVARSYRKQIQANVREQRVPRMTLSQLAGR